MRHHNVSIASPMPKNVSMIDRQRSKSKAYTMTVVQSCRSTPKTMMNFSGLWLMIPSHLEEPHSMPRYLRSRNRIGNYRNNWHRQTDSHHPLARPVAKPTQSAVQQKPLSTELQDHHRHLSPQHRRMMVHVGRKETGTISPLMIPNNKKRIRPNRRCLES